MLIDIFARRYEAVPVRDTFEERDRRLLVQAFRILSEDISPEYRDGKEDAQGVAFWTTLHTKLSRELGLQNLSNLYYSYTMQWGGKDIRQTSKYSCLKVCENWTFQTVSGDCDTHIKERISLIEIGFRAREHEIFVMNATPITLSASHRSAVSQSEMIAGIKSRRLKKTEDFRAQVDELNARFRQANYGLHYHNGFIQASTDETIQTRIEDPFWALINYPTWQNVDLDMKEALDLRDTDGRDPAFYAARSLESTIKIISDMKGWSHGKEKGAHNFIDNLMSKANGFISAWEGASLKEFFTHVRNPFGHGPGADQMPSLSLQQTEWAIEFSMIWTKSLIRRL